MQAEMQKSAASNPVRALDRDPVYLKIRDLVYQACGIYHTEEKLYLLSSACQRRMADSKAACKTAVKAGLHDNAGSIDKAGLSDIDPRQYLDLLSSPASRALELRELLNEITIGETCLFRSQPQINALQNVILPQLVATRSKLGLRTLRVWSAGCSTGEEPYTLAMLLLEQSDKLLKGWTFEILATDLNDRSIETAKAGIYGSYALRNTSELFKRKYFVSAGAEKLQVSNEVKSRVTFSRLNLSDDGKMLFMMGLDLIFCCNVLIYFDIASKRRVVQHFFSSLRAPGYFFLGAAESLYQVSDQFHLVHLPGTTGYLKPAPGPGVAVKP